MTEVKSGKRPTTPRARSTSPKGSSDDAGGSSPDRVVSAIIQGILAGRYVPGQKLVEADLTHALDVSRGPVREALKRLDAERVITLTRHRGAYIRKFSHKEVLDLLVVTEPLSYLLARLAAEAVAQQGHDGNLAATLKRLGHFRDTEADSHRLFERRRQFYETLIEITGNSQIGSIMPTMQLHLLRMQVQPFYTAADIRRRSAEYAAITEAVLAGDPVQAECEIIKHFQRIRGTLATMPEEAFAYPEPARLGSDDEAGAQRAAT